MHTGRVRTVLTFGETLLRLQPPGWERLEQTSTFDSHLAGAESNFAIALQPLGVPVRWVSGVPDNPLGRKVLRHVQGFGVDVSRVIKVADSRLGLFFLEPLAPPRPLQVYYDRRNSAASSLGPGDIREDWFDGAGHLHLTGITPALSESCRRLVEKLLQEAAPRGLSVSFDVNYRQGLWTHEQAARTLEPLLHAVDLLITRHGDADLLFHVKGDLQETAKALIQQFGCEAVAVTGGAEGSAVVERSGAAHWAPVVETARIDKLGAGDAFSAAVVYGYLTGDLHRGIRLGQAIAAWKYSLPGDDAVYQLEEIERLMEFGPEGLRR